MRYRSIAISRELSADLVERVSARHEMLLHIHLIKDRVVFRKAPATADGILHLRRAGAARKRSGSESPRVAQSLRSPIQIRLFQPRRKNRMHVATPLIRDRHVVQSINIREIDELDRWCRAFGVTRNQLTAAVSTVGANPDVVRRYLRC